MGKKLLFILCLFLMPQKTIFAQVGIFEGLPLDSTYLFFDTAQISSFSTDSSGLWQIGSTNKPFFSADSFALRAMMTDTTNPYSVNANAWFILTIPPGLAYNTIISFKHKYSTDSTRDGGIVEFSNDNGLNWYNVKRECNADTNWTFNGILTENFYGFNDTLLTGEPAFTGTNDWRYSRVQFFCCLPLKGTSSCSMLNIMVRFRFVSDSIADSLDGWMIDSIKFERDDYGGIVHEKKKQRELDIRPIPSHDGILYFPALEDEKKFRTMIVNNLGQTLYETNYQRQLNMSKYPKGLYFYRVSNGAENYTGKILIE